MTADVVVVPPALHTAPGTATSVATAVLALMTCFIPPIPFILGFIALFSAWRARRAARREPLRFRGSSAPVAAVVVTLIAWAIASLVWLTVSAVASFAGAARPIEQTSAVEDRW